jgi:FkbM family methyltransferase
MANVIHILDQNFQMWIRNERHGDTDVINEVIKNDTYMLREMASVLKKVKVIIDVGGHIGTFSVLAARWWPQARLFAVEPNPRSHELLALNYKYYIANTGKTYHGAVRYDKANLLTDGASATGGGFMTEPDWKPTFTPGHERYEIMATEIPLFQIGQILKENNAKRVDLLKLDCEGSEMEILRDMPDADAARIGAICGEYHHGSSEILELLCKRFPQNVSRAGSKSGHREIGNFWSLPRNAAKNFPFSF